MHLNHLSLLNFKNCAESSFDFSNRVNCFLGNNGEGKTNLLDAIYYLSNCKSYFNSIDSQNVKFNEPFFVLQGRFDLEAEKQQEIYCGVKIGQKKIIKKNKKQYKRLAEHVGLLPVVLITPYDSNLILDGSDIRRKFIDIIISQFDRDYLESLIHYNKIMAQRNALLKQFAESGNFQMDALDIWDVQLVEKGKIIHQKRKDFLEEFIPVFNQFYQDISNKSEEVGLHYSSSLNEGEFAVLLDNNIVKDRKSTYTSVGIHKDDLEFKISSIDLLSELIDKEIRDVIFKVDIGDISEQLVNDVVHIVSEHKGKHSLIFNVVDHLNKYKVDLLSRKMKVNLDREFLERIGELNQLKVKIKS